MNLRISTLLFALFSFVAAADGAVRAFTNTMGMQFVPVKAVPDVLFCRWETRVKDFATFCKLTNRTHEKPGFPQGDDHPVVNISFNDAQEFCGWLSKKEGRIYRLPSDHEWSAAVGIAGRENASASPKSKGIEGPSSKRNAIKGIYPWGSAWPPPANTGNFAASLNVDSYKYTSPVGTFKPTADGVYDLAGNVWEWCDTIYEPREHYRVMRGGSWRYADRMFLLSSFRGRGNTPTRFNIRGFRLVLEVSDGGKSLLSPTKRGAPIDSTLPGKVSSDGGKAGKIKVLLVGGRGSHDWQGFHDTIAPVLDKAGDFELKLTPNLDDLKAANFSKYHVVLFYGPGGDFTDSAQERGLLDFVMEGGGLAGVHATDAFKKSDVYWRLLGGRFITHRGGEFTIRIVDKKHAVTAPFEDFRIHDETYANEYHPEFKLHSLFRMDRGEEQQSMGWVQEFGKGRVFNTTLGHDDKAWRNEYFQKLVLRGLYWAARREPR